MNLRKKNFNKYNTSFVEIIKGKYVGDNITLICRIGRGEVLFDLI
jgi:transcription elongation factor